MKIQIITLFPEMFEGAFGRSMLFKAQDKKLLEVSFIQLRDFGLGPRKIVDDTPFGGGDGMLLKPEPIYAAVEAAKKQDPAAAVILMSPRGHLFNHQTAQRLAHVHNGLIIICARYEGYDERIIKIVDEQISIGGYILTGGEIPAMVVVDAVVRLIPGVLGGQESATNESFVDGNSVEYPHYTRPRIFNGLSVPPELLSGNHELIKKWRQEQSIKRTQELLDRENQL